MKLTISKNANINYLARIVLRREVNGIDVYKLKSINFLEKESKMLDRGEIDIESNQ